MPTNPGAHSMAKKILIIDDDVDLVEVIRLTLETKGLEVIDAQDGTRGLSMAEREKPDLIILDVMMETIDEGFYVAHKLRSNPLVANIPILMLTAVGQETGYHYEKDSGILPVDEFIEKPIMPDSLVNIVQKHLIMKN
jgi:DNA-binding response OmpR family regulator